MVNSGAPAWVKLISLLTAEHNVSSVAPPVSNSSYCVNWKSTPLTEKLTDLLSAQEYYTIYHQVKVAKGHTNALHERLREVVRNNNVLFHSCGMCCLQRQYDLLLFSSCFISCSNGLILQKMQFRYRAQLLSHLHSKTEIVLLQYNVKVFFRSPIWETHDLI